jgi:predicted nucleotidyltransferase
MGRTASDLKRAGWPADEMIRYQPWAASERYERDRGLILRREKAWKMAREATRILKSRFGATRVLVFGSLAHGAWFTPRSDVDLYAEGIPVEVFFRAEAAIEEIESNIKVDLLDARECSPQLLQVIEEEGVEL